MGFFDFLLGTEGEMKQESAFTPEQEKMMSQLSSLVSGGIGQEGQAYTGEFTPDVTSQQAQASNVLSSLLEQMNITPTDSTARYNELKANTINELKNEILPAIGESFVGSGNFWSSGRTGAQGKAVGEATSNLAKQREQMYQSDIQNTLNTAGQMGSLAQALNTFGSQQQQLEGQGKQLEYQDWLRTRPENSPYNELAMSLLQTPALTQYYEEGKPGILPDLIGAAGKVAAAMATGGASLALG